MALKTMSIDKLVKLKDQVEAALASKVIEQRRALESELSKLGRYQGGRTGRGGSKGAVSPKYRNPENPSETWAGRGLKPRWLRGAMKGGKSLEHFAIAGPATLAKTNGRKKARKTRR